MVTNIFCRLGIVRFFRGLHNRKRFKKALKTCEQLNKSARYTYIVVRLNKRPLIINKLEFKRLKRKDIFFANLTWGAMLKRQITKQNL